MSDTPLADLDRLAELTGRYARYSLSAGGLSSVIGGLLCLCAFVIGALMPLPQGLRYALAAAPLLWIISKEILRRYYYQRDGAVAERVGKRERRLHDWMTAYLVAMAVLIIGGLAWQLGSAILVWPALGYVSVVVGMPLIAWRWFWSVGDFLIGVLLLCQAAVVLVGRNYPLPWVLCALVFSFIAIAAGWREHRDYLALRRELQLDEHA